MNRQRLKTLAKYLAIVSEKHFNLESWVEIGGGTFNQEEGGIETVGCGTTACAMGWACQIPSFRRAGLHLVAVPSIFAPYSILFHAPCYHNLIQFGAARTFFGLSEDDANYLFAPDEYDPNDWGKPQAVISRINELLAR